MTLACVRAHMLLMGFAIENLVKAVAASRGMVSLQPPNKKGERKLDYGLPRTRAGHALTDAVGALGISLTSAEQDWLRRAEEYSSWAGRYPFPMNLSDYINSQSKPLRSWKPSDPDVSSGLFDKLAQRVSTSMP